MAYGALGLDFLQTLKTAFGAGKTAAVNVVRSQVGTAIAQSPEGQAAIRETIVDKARPLLVPALVVGGLLLLMRGGRR